jgi:serine protease Do
MSNQVVHIRRWVATVVVVAALAGGALLSSGLKNWSNHTVFGAPKFDVAVAHDSAPVLLGSLSNGFASVLKPALPAIVNIHTSKMVKPHGNSQFFNDPFFRQFFGDQLGPQGKPTPQREQSLGSGVIVTSDGTILTNNHVIDGASDIKVYLSDKRQYTAKLIGSDPMTDIAVLKIDASSLATLPLGDSSKLQVGDVVLAIGEPFGLGGTATMGIVSATGRGGLGIENYEDFIQTDAAINPGNSGGAMIDLHGSLIGINTAILAGNGGGNQGIGFAIPINMARKVMDQIASHGKVVRGYMGVHIQDLTPDLAKQFGLSQASGVLISDVESGKPADRAGIRKGDIILALNGETVDSANPLRLAISQTSPGSTIKLTIWRDGKTQDINVTLAELPETAEKVGAAEEGTSSTLEGVNVQNLTPDTSEELQLPAGTRGVVVTSVDASSPAAAAGLDRGVVILEVNHKNVTSVEQFKQALAGTKDQQVLLLVMFPNQGGASRYVVVEPR